MVRSAKDAYHIIHYILTIVIVAVITNEIRVPCARVRPGITIKCVVVDDALKHVSAKIEKTHGNWIILAKWHCAL